MIEDVIFKYRLQSRSGEFYLDEFPAGGTIVLFGLDNENFLSVWVKQEPRAEMYAKKFYVVGTGQKYPSHHRHVWTCNAHPYIWHLIQVVI